MYGFGTCTAPLPECAWRRIASSLYDIKLVSCKKECTLCEAYKERKKPMATFEQAKNAADKLDKENENKPWYRSVAISHDKAQGFYLQVHVFCKTTAATELGTEVDGVPIEVQLRCPATFQAK